MSRIGRKPVPIPQGVDVQIAGTRVSVKGPKGALETSLHPDMRVRIDDGNVVVERPTEERRHRALHGLTRSLIANMVVGVTEGFSKRLEIQGVGYRAAQKGSDLEISVGYSHPILVEAPDGVSLSLESPTKIVVAGADKQAVGQAAANIRALRPPDSFKGKGIRYEGEYVRKKAGKAAK
jgi:large subunit ribosomal protein L6